MNIYIAFDISADLIELGKTPVAVICGGVKSILDIQKTLEYLETQGVTVTTLDKQSKRFPSFYTPDSGIDVSLISICNTLFLLFTMYTNV